MSFAGSRPVDAEDVVADTWAKLGHRLRPIGKQVCVRTWIPRKVTDGGIVVPDRWSGFYAGLPNIDLPHVGKTAMVMATVLSIGEKVTQVSVGESVYLPRGWFARYVEMADKSMVGWVREENIWCAFGSDAEVGADARLAS